jgi:hypothetical protein
VVERVWSRRKKSTATIPSSATGPRARGRTGRQAARGQGHRGPTTPWRWRSGRRRMVWLGSPDRSRSRARATRVVVDRVRRPPVTVCGVSLLSLSRVGVAASSQARPGQPRGAWTLPPWPPCAVDLRRERERAGGATGGG